MNNYFSYYKIKYKLKKKLLNPIESISRVINLAGTLVG